jgi:hypothetical protein
MDERHTTKLSRRASAMRLLAAALAGGIGVFGVPAAAPKSAQPVATPVAVAAPDASAD